MVIDELKLKQQNCRLVHTLGILHRTMYVWVKMAKLVLDKVESIVSNGGNSDYQHFVHFPTMFSKAIFLQSNQKLGLCVAYQAGYHLIMDP